MGSETEDEFGDEPVAEPAVPDSYGMRPSAFRLPMDTRPGRVRLQVSDIGRSLDFYERVLGLRTLDRDSSRAVPGAHDDEDPLVELVARTGAKPAPPRGRLGLYHFAILTCPGARVMAAGGYRHHLGTNTWAARGARPAAEHDARLLEWTFRLYDSENIAAVGESLERSGYSVERDGADIVVRDPWGTRVCITQ